MNAIRRRLLGMTAALCLAAALGAAAAQDAISATNMALAADTNISAVAASLPALVARMTNAAPATVLATVPVRTPAARTVAAASGPLLPILNEISALRRGITNKEAVMAHEPSEVMKASIAKDLARLKQQCLASETMFEELATGIRRDDAAAEEESKKKTRDWSDELHELLGPVLLEVRALTARPREIEQLRRNIGGCQKDFDDAGRAVSNIERVIASSRDGALSNYLADLAQDWIIKSETASNRMAIAQYQLNEKIGARKPMSESVQQVARVFFRSRGRNLLLAVLMAVFVGLGMRFVRRRLGAFVGTRLEEQKREYYGRFAQLAYQCLVVIGAVLGFVLVLYLCGDWGLLSLTIILIVGLIWATKQSLVKFWVQGKYLFNLGSIREKERVIYQGIPWRVQSINFTTVLTNPLLQSGTLHVPLRELTASVSRPPHADEPWFPCRHGDWVIVDGDAPAQVQVQTPEIVVLALPYGGVKTYATPSFLGKEPANISHGFKVTATFGVDYRHQAIVLKEIPETLEAALRAAYGAAEYHDAIAGVSVMFENAGASSLDLLIIVECSGAAAAHYAAIRRLAQRVAVETATQHGWNIPFQTFTVQQASDGK